MPKPTKAKLKEAAGWKEAAIAWTVCASVHMQWAKGKDGLFTKRQEDYVRHYEEARAKYLELTNGLKDN